MFNCFEEVDTLVIHLNVLLRLQMTIYMVVEICAPTYLSNI